MIGDFPRARHLDLGGGATAVLPLVLVLLLLLFLLMRRIPRHIEFQFFYFWGFAVCVATWLHFVLFNFAKLQQQQKRAITPVFFEFF